MTYYFDMDGVLADFHREVYSYMNAISEPIHIIPILTHTNPWFLNIGKTRQKQLQE